MIFRARINSKKTLLIFGLLLVINFLIFVPLFNENNSQIKKTEPFDSPNKIKNQAISIDGNDIEYSGIAEPWNITHFANSTKNDESFSFLNGSYDSTSMNLGTGWEGYQLNASIKNLYDIKNWNNGTFHYGDDSGMTTDNDTSAIANNFQNWTFHESDVLGNPNSMSGNYFDNIGNQDCLELRMDGYSTTGWEGYDAGDKCMWNTSFQINRGLIVDSELQFDINPYYLTQFNSWDFNIRLNNEIIYSEGINSLRLLGEGEWHTIKRPQDSWLSNISKIYDGVANDTIMSISISLEYNAATARYSDSFYHIDYQQLFFDNVKLITKAEALPSQINLRLNNQSVNDGDWGEGNVLVYPEDTRWIGDSVGINYTTPHEWGFTGFTSTNFEVDELSLYKIELNAVLSLYTIMESPESLYLDDGSSEGTNFNVLNNSKVNWMTYARIDFPQEYTEENMVINFPSNVNITHVYAPEDRDNNIVEFCDTSIEGQLSIPVYTLTTSTAGSFKVEGTSPNYCTDISVFNNVTGTWMLNNSFFSGDYINITAQINKTEIIQNYINQTTANLEIYFPDNSIWISQSKLVQSDGTLNFEPIFIPDTEGFDYEFGRYKIVFYWNNSFANFGVNQTGIITQTFDVIHEAILEPEEGTYVRESEGIFYFDAIKSEEESTKNIRLEFYDELDGTPINDAEIYGIIDDERKDFSLIDDGLYLLELNISEFSIGTKSMTIYSNSAYHINESINIEINVKPPAPVWPLQLGLSLAILAAAALGSYLILYLKIFRYPSQIRKIRKYRKSLKKEKMPKVEIRNRKRSFKYEYQQQTSKRRFKDLKSKISGAIKKGESIKNSKK